MDTLVQAIILAAGKGTRMKTDLPKCAIPFFGKPMIRYIVDACHQAKINDICVVVGDKQEVIKDLLKDEVSYAFQARPLGTASAVMAAKDFFQNKKGITIILPGDMPLIKPNIILDLIKKHQEAKNDLTILSTILDNPTSFGRVIRNHQHVLKIVEEKDASLTEKQIKEINTSLYCIKTNLLEDALTKITNHNQSQEFYLTDIVEILAKEKNVDTYLVDYDFHLIGINDLDTLANLEKKYQAVINKKLMLEGVHLIMPDSILIDEDVKIGHNVTIDAYSIIRGNTTIPDNIYIPPYSLIVDNKRKN